MLALYIGGMGAREVNFSNQLARRYGYEQEAQVIQDLYLSGRKAEAAAAVPDELVRDTSLVGPLGYVKERLAAYAAARRDHACGLAGRPDPRREGARAGAAARDGRRCLRSSRSLRSEWLRLGTARGGAGRIRTEVRQWLAD